MQRSVLFVGFFLPLLALGRLDTPLGQEDKAGPLGQHFIFIPPSALSTDNIDYYDAVARGLDDETPKVVPVMVVDGETGTATGLATEPILSDPDYVSLPSLKFSQKDLETKKLSNILSVGRPMEEMGAEMPREVDGETKEDKETPQRTTMAVPIPSSTPLVPTLIPKDLPMPPVAPRFQH